MKRVVIGPTIRSCRRSRSQAEPTLGAVDELAASINEIVNQTAKSHEVATSAVSEARRTAKTMTELGDKVSADTKGAVTTALEDAKKALEKDEALDA